MIKLNNENEIVVVKPRSKRAIKGSMNIKKILYAELNEKIKAMDFMNLSEEDKKLIEKRNDINHMKVTINSFIPDKYLDRLSEIQNRVRNIYRSHCITDDCLYMTKAHFEDMKMELIPNIEECRKLIDEIAADWDNVLKSATNRLYNVAEDKITMEEARAIIEKKVPSVKQFKNSYDNVFCYTVAPLDKNLTYVNVGSNEEQKGDDFYLGEIQTLLKSKMMEIVETLDSLLYNKEMSRYDFGDKPKQLRPRGRLKACNRTLERFTEAFKDNDLIALSNRIEEISNLGPDEDYILYEEAEYLCVDILAKMYSSKMLKADEYPEELEFMKKDKYTAMKKQKDMYTEVNQFQEQIRMTV